MAFTRQTTERERRRNETILEIYIADARGRVLRNLSRGFAVFNTDPAGAPGGRRIAFTGEWRGSQIAVVGRDGRHPRVVVVNAFDPDWSPDGTRLAFASKPYPGDFGPPPSVYSVRLDGRDRRLIAEHAFQPDFSPDGRRLAFIRKTGGSRETEVFVAKRRRQRSQASDLLAGDRIRRSLVS